MNGTIQRIFWWIFATLCILIGLYPLAYLFMSQGDGLLSTKSAEILSNQLWNIGFYGHITFGGLALLIGWTQFSKKLRQKRLELHRTIGKIYVIAALISGSCGVYIGYYATGGLVSSTGFMLLGVVWLVTTIMAYNAIRNKRIDVHENLMILSYAACFSAVTLRIWLPILSAAFGDFFIAYKIVAWLCWVPNVLIAYFFIVRRKANPSLV